jgi:hypothetical protein
LIVKKGNSQDFEQGTWAHPLLALNFGRWISPEFAIWCDKHIRTLLETGSVSLIPQEKQPLMRLTTQLIALETARIVDEIYRMLSKTQPRTAQVLIDSAISGLMPNQHLLEAERLKGVVELVEQMGYRINIKNRGQLGKFVKKDHRDLAIEETRLVNGTFRPVACYPEHNEEVRKTIRLFFENNH